MSAINSSIKGIAVDPVNVLIGREFSEDLIQRIRNVDERLHVTVEAIRDPDNFPEIIAETDIFYAGPVLPAPLQASRLKWVQLHSAGLDHIHGHPLYEQTEVRFTTTSGIHAVNMGQYVLTMMLAFAHRLQNMIEDQRLLDWSSNRWNRFVPTELRGQTVGIVGYGSIGREVARLCQAFGMRVVAMKRDLRNLSHTAYLVQGTGDPDGDIPDRYYPPEALNSLVSESDFVIVTAPLTTTTRQVFGEATFEAMKENGVLINVARGDVIDEVALVEALISKKIRGAALDVFSEEPLPGSSPLWEMDNVILSPHVAGFTPHYNSRAVDLFCDNLRRFLDEEGLINEVDRTREY